MPALACVVNPAIPDGQTINLYFNTGNAQLALALKSGSEADDPDTDVWAADDSDYGGYILNPSDIASDIFRGVNLVVAVTKPFMEAGGTQTINQVSIVAPVYQKLSTTSLANKTVSMCSSGHHAWVYYLNGTSAGSVSLKECNLETGNVTSHLEHQDVQLNSSLAAWFDPKTEQRLLIYQEMEVGHLKEYNVVTNQTFDLDTTGDAADLTTLAVSFVKSRVYLYYLDRSSTVRRVIKDESGVWGESHVLPGGAPKVGTSQLTVTASNGFNHLFYQAKDESVSWSEFTHIRDEI